MKDKLIVLSDIHANLTALDAVLEDISGKGYRPDGFIILGDIINYGMRPNEVIDRIKKIDLPIFVNLMGNHEDALFNGNLSSFSTERGKRMLEYTSKVLTENSKSYLRAELNPKGIQTEKWSGKNLLFIHGNLVDRFWGKMNEDTFEDESYKDFDFVFCGHSHLPYCRSTYFKVDNPDMRNKKKTVFINPGSVGQPRNQNPYAQYAYVELSSGSVHLNAVKYEVEAEYKLYPDFIDPFYKERLKTGI